MKYVIASSTRNEEKFIALTLASVTAQTQLPERWIIFDDGSTDRTGTMVDEWAKKFPWIQVIHNPQRAGRNFAAKANNVNAAFARLQAEGVPFEVFANMDTDISFGPDHCEFLLRRLQENPRLGVAGTAYTEAGWDSTADSFEGERSVHGACQFFRRQCWTDVGGYVPNPAGGVDSIAVMTARMRGWRTQNFPDRRFQHHRSMGTAQRGKVQAMFDYGQKDYYLGGSPVWQMSRAAYRLGKKPFLLGGLALFCGYGSAMLRRMPRLVSGELMRFHRAEQHETLRAIVGSLVRGRKIEKYRRSEPVNRK
jgi:glycosyltransferase involved in cell wall biosynthesis